MKDKIKQTIVFIVKGSFRIHHVKNANDKIPVAKEIIRVGQIKPS